MSIVRKCLTINGLFFGALAPKYSSEFYSTLPAQVKSGELKYTEELHFGLESTGLAVYNVQTGKNKAKSVVVVAQE